MGLFEERRNPLCLKLTMSPILGSHLLINSEVDAEALKVTPFGLGEERKEERVVRHFSPDEKKIKKKKKNKK